MELRTQQYTATLSGRIRFAPFPIRDRENSDPETGVPAVIFYRFLMKEV